MWHLSHEGLDLEDTGNEPQYEKPGFLEMSVSPLQAPDVPTYITLELRRACPWPSMTRRCPPRISSWP